MAVYKDGKKEKEFEEKFFINTWKSIRMRWTKQSGIWRYNSKANAIEFGWRWLVCLKYHR